MPQTRRRRSTHPGIQGNDTGPAQKWFSCDHGCGLQSYLFLDSWIRGRYPGIITASTRTERRRMDLPVETMWQVSGSYVRQYILDSVLYWVRRVPY